MSIPLEPYMSEYEIWVRFTRRMEGSEIDRVLVLAELNGCYASDIVRILAGRGVQIRQGLDEEAAYGIENSIQIEMYDMMMNGVQPTTCANTLHLSIHTVNNWFNDHGSQDAFTKGKRSHIDEKDGRAMYAAGASDRAVADAFGVTVPTAYRWRRQRNIQILNKRRNACEIDDAKAFEMYAHGATDRECAAALNVGRTSMQKWRAIHGIETAEGRKRREARERKKAAAMQSEYLCTRPAL